MSAPILIAQISDLHIKRPGALAYGQVDTAAALTRCVAALNRFRPRPELVVISGDLADTPVAEEYEHLKRLLAPLEIGFAAVPGNHDSRELMRTALSKGPKGGYAQPGGDALNSLQAVGPLDLIRDGPERPIDELCGVTDRDHREAGPLPEILVLDLGHGHVEPVPQPRLQAAERRPLVLQRPGAREVELERQEADA